MKRYKKIFLFSPIALASISAPVALFCGLNYKKANTTPISTTSAYQQTKNSFAEFDKNFIRKDITTWSIDIFPDALKQKSVEDFYYNGPLFRQLAEIIKNNPNLVYDWVNGADKVISDVRVNIKQDNELRLLGNYRVPFSFIKNINGRLYIDVTTEDPQKNRKPTTDTFILCGFRRDGEFLVKFNQKATEISNKIIDSINYGYRIKLNKSSYEDFVSFLCSNVFYYKDFYEPIRSEFQPIPPGFIRKINDSTLKITDVISTHKDKINPPKEIPNNQEEWIVHFYLKQENTSHSILFYLGIGLFAFLLISLAIYVVILVTKRSIRI